MKLRLLLRFSSSFSGLSSSAVLLQLAVVVLIRLPSFADGIKCVQCGFRFGEPCGQTLPTETDCGAEHTGCSIGAQVSDVTGVVTETRQCATSDGRLLPWLSISRGDGMMHEFYCGTDGCNKDQSVRNPPPQRPAPTATPQQCPPPPPEGGPLACVECGWTYGKKCGDELPPATPCKDAKQTKCIMGVHVDVKAGQVQEIRACLELDFHTDLDITPVLGNKCETAGCNGERHPSDSKPQECPADGDKTDTTTDGDGNMSPNKGEASPPAGGNSASSSRYSSSSPNQRLLCWMLAALSLLFGLVVSRFNAAA